MAGTERKEIDEEEEDEEEEDEEEEEEDEEEEEEESNAQPARGQPVRKSLQDEDEDEFDFRAQQQQLQTSQPPQQQMQQTQQQASQQAQQIQQREQQFQAQQNPRVPLQNSSERKLANDTHDEAFDVEGEEVATPTKAEAPGLSKSALMSKQLQNEAHDEAFDIDDDHHVSTPPAASGPRSNAAAGSKLTNAHHDEAFDIGDDDEEDVSSDEEAIKERAHQPMMQQQQPFNSTIQRVSKEQDEEETSSDEEESIRAAPAPAGNEYNPQEYQNLNVSKDVKDLFQFITQYKPHTIDLETKIKPFIPDYIPAVGDIDTFIKIPRPDNKTDNLGLTVLDEPASTQSNPAVVKIGLSYGSKKKAPSVFVESIEDARNRPTLVDKWITDITNLHKKKPAPTVHYTKNQPDVETLLQVWPAEFEDLLTSAITLPPGKLDVELYQYVKLICCLLDIPVYNNLIESLHVLFTLYTEFKANQHFQNGPELSPD